MRSCVEKGEVLSWTQSCVSCCDIYKEEGKVETLQDYAVTMGNVYVRLVQVVALVSEVFMQFFPHDYEFAHLIWLFPPWRRVALRAALVVYLGS